MRTRKNGRTLKTTLTSLEVVDVLVELQGARVTELADYLDIPKSVAYNHLRTLQEAGYLTMNGDEYRVGLKFRYVGANARLGDEAYQVAIQVTEEMDDQTNFDTDFIVEENGIGRYLKVHWDEVNVSSVYPLIGEQVFLHRTAAGKAILATFREEKVDRIVERWGLPTRTENTISSREALDRELERTRKRGYGLNRSENRDGTRAVGMAAFRPNGTVLGAMSISSPVFRSEEDMFNDRALKLLRTHINELEERLNERDLDSAQ